MDIKCPYHEHILVTQETVLPFDGKDVPCVIGICPQCEIYYINRLSPESRNIFHINGNKYQYLKQMQNAFSDPNAKSKKVSVPSKKECKFSKSKAANTNKNESHAPRLQGKANENTIETREAAILQTKGRILSGTYKSYHAKSVRFVKEIPSVCLIDGDELLDVKHTCFIMHGKDVKTAAHCCIRCGTAYLLEKREKEFLRKGIAKSSPEPFEIKVDASPSKELIPTIPSDAILLAEILKLGTKNTETVIIVPSSQKQNSKEGIYWVGRSKATAILYALQADPKHHFKYEGDEYKITSYKELCDLPKYLGIISRFCKPEFPQTVHIFAHKHISKFHDDEYEDVTAMIPCTDRAFPIATTVYYEKKTSRYFMNEDTYKFLRDSYGLPHLRLLAAADVISLGKGFTTLKPNSELNLLGYNVNATEGLTTAERRKKLCDIFDSGVLRKSEVMNHIEWCIKSHKNIPNHENAVSKWKEDLQFVQKYKANAQRIVWIKKIQSKFSSAEL